MRRVKLAAINPEERVEVRDLAGTCWWDAGFRLPRRMSLFSPREQHGGVSLAAGRDQTTKTQRQALVCRIQE